MKNLTENNNLFDSEGVIARLPYAGWNLVIGASSALAIASEVAPLFVIVALVALVLQFFNTTKRIRDIAGEDFKSWYPLAAIGSFFIPIVGAIVGLIILFWPGKITSAPAISNKS